MRGKSKTGHMVERGVTLIEILIALAILVVVTVAVLELFSLSYLVNMGSLARTDLQYRAERVVEGLRFLRAMNDSPLQPWTACGVNVKQITGPVGPVDIPNDPNNACWGVPGFRVVDQAQSPFVLSYSIADGEPLGNGRVWVVTVTARPAQTGPRYLGMAIVTKGVRYVAQIPK
ncbi:MAG: type IV pilus modification PilV family protein [Thermoanaerobaculum sp.]